jgi:hypothetical protein
MSDLMRNTGRPALLVDANSMRVRKGVTPLRHPRVSATQLRDGGARRGRGPLAVRDVEPLDDAVVDWPIGVDVPIARALGSATAQGFAAAFRYRKRRIVK